VTHDARFIDGKGAHEKITVDERVLGELSAHALGKILPFVGYAEHSSCSNPPQPDSRSSVPRRHSAVDCEARRYDCRIALTWCVHRRFERFRWQDGAEDQYQKDVSAELHGMRMDVPSPTQRAGGSAAAVLERKTAQTPELKRVLAAGRCSRELADILVIFQCCEQNPIALLVSEQQSAT
jgi:hypothetical protein